MPNNKQTWNNILEYDVYILHSNSGEIYLFFAYLAKAFIKKNQSKNPLFIATQKYHIDILKMYFPEAHYIFINELRLKTQSDVWNMQNHRYFILFSGNHFEKVEQDIKNNDIGSIHYAWIDVQGLVLERVKEAEAFLDKYCPDKNWRLDLIDPNDYFQNKNHWFKNFYQNIFSVKNENIHKVVRIFGFKISFRRKQYINETTIINSNKMQQAQIQLLNIILNMMSPINNAVHNIWSRMDDILKTVSDNNNKESKQ